MRIILSIFLLFQFNVRAGEIDYPQGLYLFVLPAATEIDWSSPRSLLLTTGTSKKEVNFIHKHRDDIRKSMVGHAFVYLNCKKNDGEIVQLWSSLTGQNNPEEDKDDIQKKEVGFKVLFKEYIDGEIQNGLKIRSVLFGNRAMRTGGVIYPRFLHINVFPSECERMEAYAHEFKRRGYTPASEDYDQLKNKANEDLLYFGFPLDPYKSYHEYLAGNKKVKVGGGCASYAASYLQFLEQAPLLFTSSWTQSIPIGVSLVGDGLKKKVSIKKILLSHRFRMESEEIYDILHFYDPEKMRDSIVRLQSCLDPEIENDCNWNSREGIFVKTIQHYRRWGSIFAAASVKLKDAFTNDRNQFINGQVSGVSITRSSQLIEDILLGF